MRKPDDSETPCLLDPNQTQMFPVNKIAIKVPKCTKYVIKVCNFCKFVVCFQYLSFCAIICADKLNESYYMSLLITKAWPFCSMKTLQYKSLQMHKIMG